MNRGMAAGLVGLFLLPALTGCGGKGQSEMASGSELASAPAPTSGPVAVQPEPRAAEPEGLMDFLDGAWGYRDLETGEIDILRFDGGEFSVITAAGEISGTVSPGHLYTKEDGEPDLLVLTTGEGDDYSLFSELGMNCSEEGASLGDYLVDVTVCGGEALLSLRQANNGDGILSYTLPGEGYTFLLHRKQDDGMPGTPRRDETFSGFVWRYDREQGTLWATAAMEYERDEQGAPVYTLSGDRQSAEYAISADDADTVFENCNDPAYPQAVYQLTVDGDGTVTKLTA